MTNTSEPHAETFGTDLKKERFHILYPLFKEEVFRRRNLMMAYTAIACTTFMFLLALIPFFPAQYLEKSSFRLLAGIGILIFTALFVYFIRQHADRHRMAKQQLIRLEQEAGLYLAHPSNTTNDPLYPQGWQTDWQTDYSVAVYLCSIGFLMTLVLSMFWI